MPIAHRYAAVRSLMIGVVILSSAACNPTATATRAPTAGSTTVGPTSTATRESTTPPTSTPPPPPAPTLAPLLPPDLPIIDPANVADVRQLAQFSVREARSVAISPNGRIIAAGLNSGEVKAWDLSSGQEIEASIQHEDFVNDVAFSPDGRMLATGSTDRTVQVWDTTTWEQLHTLPGENVAFSPEGSLAAIGKAGGNTQTVSVVDTATWMEVYNLYTTGYILSMHFSADGSQLATVEALATGSGLITIWDVDSGSIIRELEDAGPMAFSPDGQTLAVVSLLDDSVNLLDANSEEPLYALEQPSSTVSALAFSPDGRLLAAGLADATIALWEVTGGKRVATLSDLSGGLTSIAFSRDGRLLVSGSFEREYGVRVWGVSAQLPLDPSPGSAHAPTFEPVATAQGVELIGDQAMAWLGR